MEISSDEYRAKAMELLLLAGRADDDSIRNELLNIALSYMRLADHAKRRLGRTGNQGAIVQHPVYAC